MKEIMVRAHQLAKMMEGDYQARLALALRTAWAEAKKGGESMRKRYEEYVKSWYLWESAETRPMTFEEWKAKEEEKVAEAKAAEQITTYIPFVEKAKTEAQDKWEAYEIVQAMREVHDAECRRLHAAGEKELFNLHCIAYAAARKAIMAPYKMKTRPQGPFIATGIYDDDDNPTSY